MSPRSLTRREAYLQCPSRSQQVSPRWVIETAHIEAGWLVLVPCHPTSHVSNSEMPGRVISVAKGCLESMIAEFFLSII